MTLGQGQKPRSTRKNGQTLLFGGKCTNRLRNAFSSWIMTSLTVTQLTLSLVGNIVSELDWSSFVPQKLNPSPI